MHNVWVRIGRPAGFKIAESNSVDRSREVSVVGIILADTRLKGDEILAVTDSFMCVAVHPCRVNKSIRIAASAVMDYLESYTRLLDKFNGYFKIAKISVSVVDCSLVGSRGRIHSGVLFGRL